MISDTQPRVAIDREAIAQLCRTWQIVEFALFGSVLRDDFQPDRSDIDILLTFAPEARWTLFELIDLEDRLAELFARPVDIVEKSTIEASRNPIRKREILDNHCVIYAASRS